MVSLLKKALWFLIFGSGSTSVALAAQTTFFEVTATPYDRQMLRVESTMAARRGYSMEGLSFTLVNQWMFELRAMPYRYSKQWQTPAEVEVARMADCKGKAVALYDRMQLNGATNLRLVIGKRRASDFRTHAWLEWDTDYGTVLLDPTFNWAATIKTANRWSYIPFYGYKGTHKYQAAKSQLLVSQVVSAQSPAAPAHGMITKSERMASEPSSLLLNEGPVAPSLFSCRLGM